MVPYFRVLIISTGLEETAKGDDDDNTGHDRGVVLEGKEVYFIPDESGDRDHSCYLKKQRGGRGIFK